MSPVWPDPADTVAYMDHVYGMAYDRAIELAYERRLAQDQEHGHVSPDTCGRCGGIGCDECRYCDCPRSDCRRRRRAAT